MKLRVTVQERVYEVEVEVLEDRGAPGQPPVAPAAPRLQSSPVAASAGMAAQPSMASTPIPSSPGSSGAADVSSPVAGTIVGVKVKAGDSVSAGDTLVVLEAMKMESNIASPGQGTVREVLVKQGDLVSAGQLLVRLG